ncbi:PREDICTED: uncharacterized protein LOC104777082 [Camelina sativa]|uniref:Uncharacterized protein LOC104777082 n=1 Tax=Camelina sativa TaxID=90675 RepID=A0ABM1QIT7_CAMSA|nr:PREDICTED: uncharacterized protein LOC104777082 [Camelina sativa]
MRLRTTLVLLLELLTIIFTLTMQLSSRIFFLFFDDLKPYALVQFVHCIAIPLMFILLPPMYTHSTYWLWAAGFYLLAKVEEAADKPIYSWELTGNCRFIFKPFSPFNLVGFIYNHNRLMFLCYE